MIATLLPPATLGIVGGGQLGMMTVREARRMGYRSVVWDPDPACPAARIVDELITAPFADANAAERLAQAADALTYEFEHIDVELVRSLSTRRRLRPGHEILKIAQHRAAEKRALQSLGIPVARFAVALSTEEVRKGFADIGFPAVVKTASAGYDGKGQSLVQNSAEAEEYLRAFTRAPEEVVLEEFLQLQSEVSVIAARDDEGRIREFPVAENEHRDHILHRTVVPSVVHGSIERQALELARKVIEGFGVVGLLCVEMFVTGDGRVLVNEIAPRPHNSGHFTLDACSVSQFEALVRIVVGLELPEPRLLSPCAMLNILGKHVGVLDLAALHRLPGVKVHWYGKQRVEPRRKMGHISVTAERREQVLELSTKVQRLMGEPVSKEKE